MSNPRSEDKEFDARAVRNVLGTFPTDVCILTARTLLGEDLGFTISSLNALPLDPPLVVQHQPNCSQFAQVGKV